MVRALGRMVTILIFSSGLRVVLAVWRTCTRVFDSWGIQHDSLNLNFKYQRRYYVVYYVVGFRALCFRPLFVDYISRFT